jgi:hypothetical protein
MSACNVVGLGGLPTPRCFVHDHDAPCPHDGQPAAEHPIHVFAQPDQIEAVNAARDISRGARPIRVHQGTEGSGCARRPCALRPLYEPP